MVRKKDRFWEYIEELNGHFKCKFCECNFAGVLQGLTHTQLELKVMILVFVKKVPTKVQEEASLNIGQPNKKLKGALTSSKAEERKISSTSIAKDNTLSGLFKKVSDVCNQCCKYFIVRLYFAIILVEIISRCQFISN